MKYSFFAVIFFSLSLCVAATPVKYTVQLSGNHAGFQTVEDKGQGLLQIHFEYNDRGRGPKLDSQIMLDPSGIPVSVETSGIDYYKGPVQESFRLSEKMAQWKNQGEEGKKGIDEKAFWLSLNGSPEEIGLLTRAALRSGGKLSLLPDGQSRVEKILDLKVTSAKQERTITLYGIQGLDFIPTPVWLEADGTLFAVVSVWLSVIREGWEPSISELQKAQDQAAAIRTRKLAGSLAYKPAGLLVFRSATVFDSETATVHPDWTVIVNGNKIQAVGPDSEIKVPEEAEVIDASGKMLIPGLWDMHVHLGDSDGALHLAAGVTSVRDMANDIDKVMGMRKQFDDGTAVGPRVMLAGFIDSPGPYAGPSKVLVDNEEQGRAAVDRYAELGYEQIKLYSSLKPELVSPLIDEAHKKGLRVSGHIPAFMTAEQCVKLGFNEIQHANFLFLNFWPDVKDTRTPLRFTAVAERAADLDLKSEKVQSFIKLLLEHNVDLDPTVNVFENLFMDRPGKVSSSFASVSDRLPAQIRRSLLTGGLPVPEGMDQRYRDSFQAVLNMVKEMVDSGVTIVAGTDSLAGFGLHRELELYAQAGIPNTKILQLATIGSARVMKHDKELGSITPGKLADMVLIDGDPVTEISDIRRVKTIVKNGIVYQASELCETMGIKPK